MQTKVAEEILKWLKSTDLVEVRWESDGQALDLRLSGAGPSAAGHAPIGLTGASLRAVPSPAVGVFRWAAPGQPRRAEEGKAVAPGTRLGIIEGVGPVTEVAAPEAGTLFKICVDEGQAVQYGQPLFLIKPG